MLPLECEALAAYASRRRLSGFGAATRPSGSKLPRHRLYACRCIESRPTALLTPTFFLCIQAVTVRSTQPKPPGSDL
ncbi:hypothetical protein C1886_22315 [Pseudomonas sp. FW300-N1A1]|nr:hypothetical protein C1886_22315 [Pseudomonas sp. FW300-N1A1]